jgi:hypothetical protein
MALDFQQVRNQIKQMGEKAPQRARQLSLLRQQAQALLESYALEATELCQIVKRVVREHDTSLRCALPLCEADAPPEPLNAHIPLPEISPGATVLAADGSQINFDRHAPVEFGLINVGAFQLDLNSSEAPLTSVHTRLLYDDELHTPAGTLTEARLALMRDIGERKLLSDLAAGLPPPVITFTDGPMELWGTMAHDGEATTEFQKRLDEYLQVLAELSNLGAITAGYVDKPSASPVVRLLEVAFTPQSELAEIKNRRPLRGVSDRDLFQDLLAPGERSAVFALQSFNSRRYEGALALHFFYLNVGRPGHPWLARVDIPAWVAHTPDMLEQLHAVLVSQCRITGSRPYPYALHRAHETALVTLQEREQVIQMIAQELWQREVLLGEISQKQAIKDLHGRTRYK